MAAVKKASVKAAEVMEETAKAPEAVQEAAEEKKEPAKKPGRKPAVKKETAKEPAAKKETTAKKEAAKKAADELKASVYIQFDGGEASVETLVSAAKQAYVALGHKEEEIKTLDVYVKPQEHAAYYAVNGEGSEEFRIEY